MTWIRHQQDGARHTCALPIREVVHLVPTAWGGDGVKGERESVPDGQYGDLWRCDDRWATNENPEFEFGCGELWRIGSSCDYGPHDGGNCPRGGYHPSGLKWRPATFWQRLWNRRRS